MTSAPLVKRVFRSGRKPERGRINLPASWIGTKIVVAPERDYVVVPKAEYERLKRRLRSLTFVKEMFESVLNAHDGRKMFSVVSKTWNPVTGCLHMCSYCWARRLAETKLRNSERYREGFVPRLNERELRVKFGPGDVVFVSDMGDLFGDFVPGEWISRVLAHTRRFPETYFLFLTKNPARYKEFLDEMPERAILGATIETDRDDLYVREAVSGAPLPSRRYEAMRDLEWDAKFVSIEPILDFDPERFPGWIEEIGPVMVYVGYDNYSNRLPEPPLRKTLELVERLSEITLVVRKTMRRAWNEGIEAYAQGGGGERALGRRGRLAQE